jgi:archaellum component FlaC
MTIKRYAGDKLTGLSSDTKPTNIPDGATFYETNTLSAYILTGGTWVMLSNVNIVQSNLTSLTTSVGTISSNVNTLTTNLGTVSSNVNTLTTNLSTVSSNVNTLTTNLGTVSSNLNSLTTSVNGLQANINTVQSNVTTLTTSVNGLQANINSVASNVNTVNANVVSVAGSVNTVQSNLTTLTTSVGTISSNVNTVTTNLGTISSNLNALTTSVSTISSNVNTLTTNLGTVSSNLNSLTTSVGTISSNVNILTTNLGTVSSNLNALTTSVNGLQANINTVQGNVTSLTTSTNTIRANVDSVASNVANILNGTTAFTGNIRLTAGINASSSVGTAGQVLTSNGTIAYWSSLAGSNYAYGAFQSTSNQFSNANTATAMLFEQTDLAGGVTMTANSYIGLPNAGTYNLQFSVQTKNTGSAEDTLYIWLRQNNVDIAGSTGKVLVRGTQAGGSGEGITGWNFFVKSNTANENIRIMWFAPDETHTHLAAFPAQSATGTVPAIPSTASTVLTVNQVVTSISASAAIAVRTTSIADGTSITVNADTTDLAYQTNTQSAGTLTINAPIGSPADGQKIIIRITSTNIQTLSFDPSTSVFVGSVDAVLPTATTGSSETDYLGFIYSTSTSKWHLIAKNFGF